MTKRAKARAKSRPTARRTGNAGARQVPVPTPEAPRIDATEGVSAEPGSEDAAAIIKRRLVAMLADECPSDTMLGQSEGRVIAIREGRPIFIEIAAGRTVVERREFADRVKVARGRLLTLADVSDIRTQLGPFGLVLTMEEARRRRKGA